MENVVVGEPLAVYTVEVVYPGSAETNIVPGVVRRGGVVEYVVVPAAFVAYVVL